MVEITRRQMDALDFIKRFIAIHNTTPSLATIARGIKSSTSSAGRMLQALVDVGIIERDYYARDYKIVREASLKGGEGVD